MMMSMPSVVQYKRTWGARTAIRRTLPPADHNIPGLPTLSREEIICVEQARAALATMRQTFEHDGDRACAQDARGQGPPHGRSHLRPPVRARGARQ
jgi:hypothetical protein